MYRIKIAESDFEQLRQLVAADHPREGAAFALAGVAELAEGTDVLIRRVVPIPSSGFEIQEEDHLRLAPATINGLISLCEASGLGALLCHSHPFDAPYSPADDRGELRVAQVLHQFLRPAAPVASLLFTPGGIDGRVWPRGAVSPVQAGEIVLVGHHVRRYAKGPGEIIEDPDPIYDRQVRAFGKEGQRRIAASKVAIVGTGGTGSPTAEQLVRLGVQDLLLIDPDDCEDTNLTRVYGTFADALRDDPPGKKVELVARHLRLINPAAHVRTIALNIADDEAARELRDRDYIFVCTDDHWGRSVVNQVAHQYLIPSINMGVRVAADRGTIHGATGSVDALRPDVPCLWCKQFLNPRRIAAESLPADDRLRLEREGYVEGLETKQPAVVSLTTAVAGHAVTLFLQLVTGFMGDGGDVQRLTWNILDGTVRRGRTPVDEDCMCGKVRGRGDLAPRPTMS